MTTLAKRTLAIGIVTSTLLEWNAWKRLCPNENSRDKGTEIPFRVRTSASGDLVVVLGGIGKVEAASAATFLCERFNLAALVDFGTAGALTTAVDLGTIHAPRKIIEYDFSSDFMQKPAFSRSKDLPRRLLVVLDGLGKAAVSGMLLSGDQDVLDDLHRTRLKSEFAKASLVCWETAAICKVATRYKLPWIALRIAADGPRAQRLSKPELIGALNRATHFFGDGA